MTGLVAWVRALWSGVPAGARDRVDVDSRLASTDMRPHLYLPCPPTDGCRHRWVDCRVDAWWCGHPGEYSTHPGKRCLLCPGVVDLIVDPAPRDADGRPR